MGRVKKSWRRFFLIEKHNTGKDIIDGPFFKRQITVHWRDMKELSQSFVWLSYNGNLGVEDLVPNKLAWCWIVGYIESLHTTFADLLEGLGNGGEGLTKGRGMSIFFFFWHRGNLRKRDRKRTRERKGNGKEQEVGEGESGNVGQDQGKSKEKEVTDKQQKKGA